MTENDPKMSTAGKSIPWIVIFIITIAVIQFFERRTETHLNSKQNLSSEISIENDPCGTLSSLLKGEPQHSPAMDILIQSCFRAPEIMSKPENLIKSLDKLPPRLLSAKMQTQKIKGDHRSTPELAALSN